MDTCGYVVCVTAFGQLGRGYESGIMPIVKHFLSCFPIFTLVADKALHQLVQILRQL
jgi:hypothetical protein